MSSDAPGLIILDVSPITHTLDRDEIIPLLAWQYVVERCMVEKFKFTINSDIPFCRSLEKYYPMIRKHLASEHNLDVLMGDSIIALLKHHVISLYMTRDVVVINLRSFIEE